MNWNTNRNGVAETSSLLLDAKPSKLFPSGVLSGHGTAFV